MENEEWARKEETVKPLEGLRRKVRTAITTALLLDLLFTKVTIE